MWHYFVPQHSPSFSHTDGLLLHGLMDAGAVVLFDAVELIDAAQTSIRENECSCLQVPLSWVLDSRHCQTWPQFHNHANNDATALTAYCTIEIEYCLVFFKINKYKVCEYSNVANFVANKCGTIFNFIGSRRGNVPIRHCKPLQYYTKFGSGIFCLFNSSQECYKSTM